VSRAVHGCTRTARNLTVSVLEADADQMGCRTARCTRRSVMMSAGDLELICSRCGSWPSQGRVVFHDEREPSHAVLRQLAPRPVNTTGTVLQIRPKSPARLQWSMYRMSRSIQSWNEIAFRPPDLPTRHVESGRTDRRRRCQPRSSRLVGDRRTRADDRHVAAEHVHELRELVDAVLAQ